MSGDSQSLNYPSLLLRRIDTKITKAYVKAMNSVQDDRAVWSRYYRCRMIQDHISAMTDHSALDEFKLLSVSG